MAASKKPQPSKYVHPRTWKDCADALRTMNPAKRKSSGLMDRIHDIEHLLKERAK